MTTRFEWNDEKDRSNRRKHGVSFAEAVSAFADPHSLYMPDPDHSVDEERFVLIGRSAKFRILVVCHCYREADTVIRIFSARKALRGEFFEYEERIP